MNLERRSGTGSVRTFSETFGSLLMMANILKGYSDVLRNRVCFLMAFSAVASLNPCVRLQFVILLKDFAGPGKP